MTHLLNKQSEKVIKLNGCQGSVKREFIAITNGNINCFNTLEKQYNYMYLFLKSLVPFDPITLLLKYYP